MLRILFLFLSVVRATLLTLTLSDRLRELILDRTQGAAIVLGDDEDDHDEPADPVPNVVEAEVTFRCVACLVTS
ncbi:MAG TPA: hypothetical protein VKE74_28685 [Gemmataceae bacterium]|nr:hypothetical protein [Gemmataceae bacterium]